MYCVGFVLSLKSQNPSHRHMSAEYIADLDWWGKSHDIDAENAGQDLLIAVTIITS
jgi:hypothetical protein